MSFPTDDGLRPLSPADGAQGTSVLPSSCEGQGPRDRSQRPLDSVGPRLPWPVPGQGPKDFPDASLSRAAPFNTVLSCCVVGGVLRLRQRWVPRPHRNIPDHHEQADRSLQGLARKSHMRCSGTPGCLAAWVTPQSPRSSTQCSRCLLCAGSVRGRGRLCHGPEAVRVGSASTTCSSSLGTQRVPGNGSETGL